MELDQDVINLAKAIRQIESGNRAVLPAEGISLGGASRYQFTTSTWNGLAKKYLNDINAPLTLENENKVAYNRIKEWKNAGYNPAQIASMWNAGEGKPNAYKENWRGINEYGVKFDTPAYVKKVYAEYQKQKQLNPPLQTTQQLKYETNINLPSPIIDSSKKLSYQKSAQETKALFPAEPITSIKQVPKEVIKSISNLPTSAINLFKGIISLPKNSYNTFMDAAKEYNDLLKENNGNVAKTREMFARSYGKTILDVGKNISNKIKDITPEEVVQTIHQTAVNDPLLIPTIAEIGASKLGKTKQLENLLSKVTKPTETLIKKTVSLPTGLARRTGEFGVSQATGLQPETVKTVIKQPEIFKSKIMAGISREQLGEDVLRNIEVRISKLSDTGKNYDKIRASGETVVIDPKNIQSIFNKYNIKFDDNGKIIRTLDTVPLKEGDVRALEDFFNIYGKDVYYNANSFLNARTALSNLAEYDASKSDISNRIARELRQVYDLEGKKQITGLKELDAKYAPLRAEFSQLKKDYLKKDLQTGEWGLKDGAFNKIANLTGKGKQQTLDRLEQIRPGITEEINILKAVENIKDIKGIKPGTYVRGGAIIGGVSTGNIPLVLTAIASQPEIALQIIRTYGYAKKGQRLFTDNIINKIKKGLELNEQQKEFIREALIIGKIQ
jgi:hypothetical protein